MKVGTSRSSARALIIGRGRSSNGRGMVRGAFAGSADVEPAAATDTDSRSKPVAMTVILIWSRISSSITAPKMIWHLIGSFANDVAAAFTSKELTQSRQ